MKTLLVFPIMKKKYTTRSLAYAVTINVDGKPIDVKFEKTSSNFKGLAYITDDEKIQKALESTKAFRNSFTLDPKFVDDSLKKEEILNDNVNDNNDGMVEKPFATVNEAKDFFNKEHGIPVSKLMTRAAISMEAEKLGFEVQFDNQ